MSAFLCNFFVNSIQNSRKIDKNSEKRTKLPKKEQRYHKGIQNFSYCGGGHRSRLSPYQEHNSDCFPPFKSVRGQLDYLTLSLMDSSLLQKMRSGERPRPRSSRTLAWVGLVLCSPQEQREKYCYY